MRAFSLVFCQHRTVTSRYYSLCLRIYTRYNFCLTLMYRAVERSTTCSYGFGLTHQDVPIPNSSCSTATTYHEQTRNAASDNHTAFFVYCFDTVCGSSQSSNLLGNYSRDDTYYTIARTFGLTYDHPETT